MNRKKAICFYEVLTVTSHFVVRLPEASSNNVSNVLFYVLILLVSFVSKNVNVAYVVELNKN